MFKQKKMLFIYLTGLILTSVIIVIYLLSHTYLDHKKNIYDGESNNWSASYIVDINKDNKLKSTNIINTDLVLFYKNYLKGSGEVKIIEYDMKSSARKLRGEVNFSSHNKDGKVHITSSNKNLAYESKDEEIKLLIKWNGKEEEIKLKRNVPK
jgi:hypothetical protein